MLRVLLVLALLVPTTASAQQLTKTTFAADCF